MVCTGKAQRVLYGSHEPHACAETTRSARRSARTWTKRPAWSNRAVAGHRARRGHAAARTSPWQVLLRSMPRHASFRFKRGASLTNPPSPCGRQFHGRGLDVKQAGRSVKQLAIRCSASPAIGACRRVNVLEIAPHMCPARDSVTVAGCPLATSLNSPKPEFRRPAKRPGRARRLGLARAGRQNRHGRVHMQLLGPCVVGRLRPAVRPAP